MKNRWMGLTVATLGLSLAGLSLGAVQAAAQGPQGVGSTAQVRVPAGTRADSGTVSRKVQVPRSLKPVKFVKEETKQEPAEPKMATERHAANSNRLTKSTLPLQVQGLLPPNTDLKDACSHFKVLSDCVAALHASNNLGLNFNCLKWDLTGVPLTADPSSCAAPGSGNIMTLSKAIQALKPDAYGKDEAMNAQKQAHDDLKEGGLEFSRGPGY